MTAPVRLRAVFFDVGCARSGCAPVLVTIHVWRGPWGRLQRTSPEAAIGPDDLASLPQALASLL